MPLAINNSFIPKEVSSMIDNHANDSYQEYVTCPNGETNMFMVGMDSWRSVSEVMQKASVIGDLPFVELLGFLTPAVVIGYFGYQILKRG